MKIWGVALAALMPALAAGSASSQDFQISAYGGWQSAPHSHVTVTGSNPEEFTTGWDGKSFEMPPYYGVRGTWWMDSVGLPNTGLSIDFSHSKVYSLAEDRPAGWTKFEFTDGLNVLTANLLYRFDGFGGFVPYVGAGAGITIPHVEVTRSSGSTFEYQHGGPAAQIQAGVEYRFTENWAVFAEYKGNYSLVDVEIDGGDRLKSNIITNAVNVGVSLSF